MSGGDWQNDRLETAYDEARTVLNAQQDAIQDIDNKAMFTNRVIVIFIGIIIAAARLGDGDLFNPYLLGIGALLLFASFAVGVKIYSYTDLFTGPNRVYLHNLVENDVDAETWDADLIFRIGDWIDQNDGDIRSFTRLLFAQQTAMLFGVTFILGAVPL